MPYRGSRARGTSMKTVQHHPDPLGAELDAASRALEARLRARTNAFETRYEFSSAEVESAVDQGLIRETAEVAEWIIAVRTLRRLERERQARPE